MPFRHPTSRPSWWPAGEPWPPPSANWHYGPHPFVRRLGCFFFALFGVALVGISAAVWSLTSALAGGAGRPLHPALLLAAVLLFLMLAGSFATRSFRRLAGPIGDIMLAVQRVEAGDFTARVPEPQRSPRELRALVRSVNVMIARLESDESRRRALLADVSHELRTPLAVIQGEVEAIIDGVHPADQARLNGILDEVQVLSRLVEDLRTLALSEAGTLALHPEPTDISVLVTEVAESFGEQAKDAGVHLDVAISNDIPLLDVDPIRIREVFSNLVVNALRYTPSGGTISISAAMEDTSVTLAVADTGAGIDPKVLSHLFERFAKGAGSRGSGLGLAIARSLVEAHGGQIAADSAPDHGTTVRIRLPVDRR